MLEKNQIHAEQSHFAQKYDREKALNYYSRYYKSPRRYFLNWLEQCMAKRALTLAGHPKLILDIPCGTGRFWKTLTKNATLWAADFNPAMIEVGMEKRNPKLVSKIQGSVASAFNLPFPDNSVESIFCMRFLHHIAVAEDRASLFKELARVSYDTIAISCWVAETGIKGKARLQKEAKRKPGKEYNKFTFTHEQLIKEFQAAGLEVVSHLDMLPHLSPWRLYVLKKPQALSVNKLEYVCPHCTGALTPTATQLICTQDKLAYPLHPLPLLTKREAIKLV